MRKLVGVSIGVSLAAVLLLGTATPAAADDKDNPFEKTRNTLTAGMLIGGFSVGPVGGVAVGGHLDVGRQMGALNIFGSPARLVGDPSGGLQV